MPCCLPSFPNPEERGRHPAYLRLGLTQIRHDQLKSEEYQGRLDSLLQTAWALVLCCYTDLDEVCFGQQIETNASEDAENTPIPIVRFGTSQNQRVCDLVHKKDNPVKIQTGLEDAYLLFNTIFISKGTIVSSTSQSSISHSLPENESLHRHML